MDFGASIAIVLGAPAAVAIAKGLADWLRGREKVEITIQTAAGTVVARGGPPHKLDVVKAAAALRGEPPGAMSFGHPGRTRDASVSAVLHDHSDPPREHVPF